MEEETDPLKVLLVVILALMSIPAAWIVWGYYYRGHQCVRLENGAVLGYEAVFDLRGPYFRSIVVPKLPDGRPIVGDETEILRVTDTSIYGVTEAADGSGARFAWRPDTGLFFRKDDRRAYDEIVSTAGHANWDIGINYINAGGLMFWLLESGRFPKEWCPTRLVTW